MSAGLREKYAYTIKEAQYNFGAEILLPLFNKKEKYVWSAVYEGCDEISDKNIIVPLDDYIMATSGATLIDVIELKIK